MIEETAQAPPHTHTRGAVMVLRQRKQCLCPKNTLILAGEDREATEKSITISFTSEQVSHTQAPAYTYHCSCKKCSEMKHFLFFPSVTDVISSQQNSSKCSYLNMVYLCPLGVL